MILRWLLTCCVVWILLISRWVGVDFSTVFVICSWATSFIDALNIFKLVIIAELFWTFSQGFFIWIVIVSARSQIVFIEHLPHSVYFWRIFEQRFGVWLILWAYKLINNLWRYFFALIYLTAVLSFNLLIDQDRITSEIFRRHIFNISLRYSIIISDSWIICSVLITVQRVTVGLVSKWIQGIIGRFFITHVPRWCRHNCWFNLTSWRPRHLHF